MKQKEWSLSRLHTSWKKGKKWAFLSLWQTTPLFFKNFSYSPRHLLKIHAWSKIYGRVIYWCVQNRQVSSWRTRWYLITELTRILCNSTCVGHFSTTASLWSQSCWDKYDPLFHYKILGIPKKIISLHWIFLQLIKHFDTWRKLFDNLEEFWFYLEALDQF